MSRASTLKAISVAASRAEGKHGLAWIGSPHLYHERRLTITAEEFGEVARSVCEGRENRLREEILDLAACCVGWLEALG